MLITGLARLGRAIVLAYAAEDARVTLTYKSSMYNAEEVVFVLAGGGQGRGDRRA
jgi:NAD(P)-dependent dehydrogenase (short-subunit alcohol dehydrogenase family)